MDERLEPAAPGGQPPAAAIASGWRDPSVGLVWVAAATALAALVIVGGAAWIWTMPDRPAPAGANAASASPMLAYGAALLAAIVVLAGFVFAIRLVRRHADSERQRGEVAAAQLAQRTQELARERELAMVSARIKTRFLATMSHELRTPMNAVLGAAQLLEHTELGPDQGYLVDAVRDNGAAMLSLIENLLDMSRIEAGEMALVEAPFDLTDCVEGALATIAVHARTKGLAIAAIVDPALPAWRRGDTMRLRQVILSLLGNAVKFTAEGEVVLQLVPGGTPTRLHLSVRDTGIGIDPERAARVFEPFSQADDTSTRRFGGTGLGLTIARELVRRMGGDITVRSEPTGGARFDVELDLQLAPQREFNNPRAGQPVAFYEAHEPSALALGATLVRMGFEVQRCLDGRALHDWVSRHMPPPGQTARYWVFVSTDHASVLGVLEAAAEVIEPSRVIGMTNEVCYDAEFARETMGLARSVIKPVLRTAIVSRMGAVENAAADDDPPRRSENTAPESIVVLVVEDDPTNSMIVCSMLQNAGMAYAAAEDGRRALQLLSSESFDVVLMDWQMPDMDGLEVARRIRRGLAGDAARLVPIIALTANAFAEDRAACLGAGMNDFLTKPVLAAKLVQTIQQWVRKDEEPAADEP